MVWAENMLKKPQKYWNRVLFSDESKIYANYRGR